MPTDFGVISLIFKATEVTKVKIGFSRTAHDVLEMMMMMMMMMMTFDWRPASSNE